MPLQPQRWLPLAAPVGRAGDARRTRHRKAEMLRVVDRLHRTTPPARLDAEALAVAIAGGVELPVADLSVEERLRTLTALARARVQQQAGAVFQALLHVPGVRDAVTASKASVVTVVMAAAAMRLALPRLYSVAFEHHVIRQRDDADPDAAGGAAGAPVVLYASGWGAVDVSPDGLAAAAAAVVRHWGTLSPKEQTWALRGLVRHQRPEAAAVAEAMLNTGVGTGAPRRVVLAIEGAAAAAAASGDAAAAARSGLIIEGLLGLVARLRTHGQGSLLQHLNRRPATVRDWTGVLQALAGWAPPPPPGGDLLSRVAYETAAAMARHEEWGRGARDEACLADLCGALHRLRHFSSAVAMTVEERLLTNAPQQQLHSLHAAAVLRWFAAFYYPSDLAVAPREAPPAHVTHASRLAAAKKTAVWADVLLPAVQNYPTACRRPEDVLVVADALAAAGRNSDAKRARRDALKAEHVWGTPLGQEVVQRCLAAAVDPRASPHGALDRLRWLVERDRLDLDKKPLRAAAAKAQPQLEKLPMTPRTVVQVLQPFAVLHVPCDGVVKRSLAYVKASLTPVGRLPAEWDAALLLYAYARLAVAQDWAVAALAATVLADPTLPDGVLCKLRKAAWRFPPRLQEHLFKRAGRAWKVDATSKRQLRKQAQGSTRTSEGSFGP